ncbi:MAG: PKD domain-containing protein [Vicingaceae bacterium]|nr:PKD domain-containing protein [Vicingaceae bacterium]
MKRILSFLAIMLISSSLAFSQYSDEYYYQKKQDYKEFLKNHEFKKRNHLTEKELKAIPKNDRPDLANEQNFLQTLDPSTGMVPANGLINAHKITDIYVQQNKTAIPGIVWAERGPNNVGGRTRAIMWDPNDPSGKTVFSGGVAGGLWKNTDITNNSTQWTPINDFWDNIAITTLAFDPSTTTTMYAGTGEGYYNVDAVRGGGIWKSTNGGTSWSRLNSTSSFQYVQKIVVHPTTGDVYACTKFSGVQRSQNGGTTWSKVLGSGLGASSNRSADLEIASDGTIFAAIGLIFSTDGVYSSTTGNSGSWSKLNTGSNGFPSSNIQRIEIACAPSNANVIYAIVQDNGSAIDGLYRSSDKGANWSSLAIPNDVDNGIPANDFTRGQAWYDLSMAVDPNDDNKLFVGGIDLFRSTNGGSSWSQVSKWSNNNNLASLNVSMVHADQHTAVYKPGSSTEILFGHDGGVSYSSNATATTPTINDRINGYNVTQYYAGAINGTSGSNNMIAGAQDNGTQKYTSAGINSTTEVTGGDGAFCHIDQSNGNNQISQYVRNVIYRTTNNWGSASIINNSQSTGLFINPSEYDDKEDIYYSGHANGTAIRLLRKINPFGAATSGTVVVATGSSDVSHISASPYASGGNSTVFVGTVAGDVYKVSNAQGSSPTVTNIGGGLPAGNISCIEIGVSEQQLLVTLSNYGINSVYETLNGGSSWTNKEGDLPDMPVRWALYNPDDRTQAFIATEVGVWSTSDLTASSVKWSPTNNGLANVRTDMLQYRSSDKTILAATHGRGLFTTAIPASNVPVADFSGTPTILCEGNTVTFTDQSTNSPTVWSWSFPGGNPATSTAQNPTITYNTAGTYNVTLTATNVSGPSSPVTKTGYITVNSVPGNAGVITGSTSECENATGIAYSISAVTGANNYNWTVPAGATVASGQGTTSITVNFGTNSGNVSVTPSNSCGNGGSNNKAINVNVCAGAPVADFSGAPRTLCEGNSVTYTDLSTNTPTGWSWSFPGGTPSTSTAQNPTITYNTAGTYNVTLTASNGSGSNPITKSSYITVNTPTGPSQPTTQIRAVDCGITLSSASKIIYADPVVGATHYQFRVTNSSLNFTYETKWWHTARWIRLMDIPGIKTNTTYNVEVRIRTSNCDVSNYSTVCPITTPGNPVLNTQIITTQCGITLNNINTPIYAKPISGATNYTFEISNTLLSFNRTITLGGRYVNLDWWGNSIQPNTTYDIKVKATVNSIVGNYSTICQITTPSTIRLGEPYTNEEIINMVNNNQKIPLDLIVYPNPNQGDFVYIDLSGVKSGTELFITDISGKVVQQQQLDVDIDSYSGTLRFNDKLHSGFYFVTVISGNQKITKKLVVR